MGHLNQGDFVYVMDEEKGPLFAVLRDIFANQVLVEVKNGESDNLVLAHRSQIFRPYMPPTMH